LVNSFFDIRILDDGGNLNDCCSIAAITALHHARRPDISINDGKVTVHPLWERDPVPLSIHHMPIAITFGIVQLDKDMQVLIVDPTFIEESVLSGKMTFTMNIHRELCGLQKAGGSPLSTKNIVSASKVAMIKVQELTNSLQIALSQDSLKRRNLKGKPKDHNVKYFELMNAGIGISEIVQPSNVISKKKEKVIFHHYTKQVTLSEENVIAQIPPLFSSEIANDFQDFLSAFSKSLPIERERDEEEIVIELENYL